MTTTLQLKLQGIFLADDSPESPTSPAGDIFSKIVSTISNFFQYLINLFNQEFPPETRDEQFHRLINVVTPYILPAILLITFLCFSRSIFSCIRFILGGCFDVIKGLFSCISSIIKGSFSFVRLIYLLRVMRNSPVDHEAGLGLTEVPGVPPVQISRADFEANPGLYLRILNNQQQQLYSVNPINSKKIFKWT